MAYDIIVLNIRDKVPDGYRVVHIHRPHILGNPFRMNREADRDEVIEKYKQWLWSHIKARSAVFEALRRIADCANDTALVCYCKPKSCHGDIIVSAVQWNGGGLALS